MGACGCTPSLKCTPLLRLYPLPRSRSAIGYIKTHKDGKPDVYFKLACSCVPRGRRPPAAAASRRRPPPRPQARRPPAAAACQRRRPCGGRAAVRRPCGGRAAVRPCGAAVRPPPAAAALRPTLKRARRQSLDGAHVGRSSPNLACAQVFTFTYGPGPGRKNGPPRLANPRTRKSAPNSSTVA